MVEGEGFEPPKPFRTPDLQSGGFNHSPTPPSMGIFAYFWVLAQSRTKNLVPVFLRDPQVRLVPVGFDFKFFYGDSRPYVDKRLFTNLEL